MAEELPFHLQGNFAPVKDELTEFDLEVEGALPPELNGMYVRNGSNPISGHSEHWFLGNGMVHGTRIENGRAAWYRNRYVQTPNLKNPDLPRISETGQIDYRVASANTSIFGHGGQLLALEEGSFPYALDRELNTLGVNDFGGKLNAAFTAHPHFCPVTGEMLGFSYGQFPPYLIYQRVSADGELVQSEVIDVPGPTMMHDFMITEKYAIFMDLPVVFDLQLALAGTMPFKWSDDYGARMGIMPRTGTNADVKWFDVNPCYVFHAMNAHDEADEGGGDKVHYDVCRISEVWREAGDMTGGGGESTLHRFTFDMKNGNVSEQTLDDRQMDFPRVAHARVGQKNRYGYTLQLDSMGTFPGHLKIDFQTGKSELHDYGKGVNPGEPTFVAAHGADPDSDEGWVMSYVYDDGSGRSELVVVDAQNFAAKPVARIKLPQRVPYGFHGDWVADPA